MRISDWSSDVCSSDLEAPKTKTVKAKAKPVQKKAAKPATKAAPKKAAAKTIAPKIKVAPKPVAAATKGFKTMNDTVKKFAEDAKARTEALTADFQERSKEALAKSSKLAEEAVEFNKANVEALVEAGKNTAKHLETLGQERSEERRVGKEWVRTCRYRGWQ